LYVCFVYILQLTAVTLLTVKSGQNLQKNDEYSPIANVET